MKTKLFTLFLALAASVGTIFAACNLSNEDDVLRFSITENSAASVDKCEQDYSGNIVIPAEVTFDFSGDKVYTVTGIMDAFSYCENLLSVQIPKTINYIGDMSFAYCSNLKSINVDEQNPYFCSVDGILYNKDKTKLIAYPGGKQGGYIIPNSVTSIGNYAFFGCKNLINIEIPSSVTSIGRYAFIGCSGLTSIICKATTPPDVDIDGLFYDGPENELYYNSIILFVPDKSIELYKNTKPWKEFTNILPLSGLYEGIHTVHYLNNNSEELRKETVKLFVPVAPTIEGFIFIGWQASGMLEEDGIILQAVYQSNDPYSLPTEISVPGNKAQKLIRNGNVYILTEDKTYTITGHKVQ